MTKAQADVMLGEASIYIQALLGDIEGVSQERTVAAARDWLQRFGVQPQGGDAVSEQLS